MMYVFVFEHKLTIFMTIHMYLIPSDKEGKSCFSWSESTSTCKLIASMALDERVKKCIQSMRFQLPQQTVNESFDQQFCNESVYGSFSMLEVTGLVCLAPIKWSDNILAFCMLSHTRLGGVSTLGAAASLWNSIAGLQEVVRIVILQLAQEDESKNEDGEEEERVELTVWPTRDQKAKTDGAVKKNWEYGLEQGWYHHDGGHLRWGSVGGCRIQ